MVYEEDSKYIVMMTAPYWFFWKKTFEYVCDTEEDVRRLRIPDDKLYINDSLPINIHPTVYDEIDNTYWDCISLDVCARLHPNSHNPILYLEDLLKGLVDVEQNLLVTRYPIQR